MDRRILFPAAAMFAVVLQGGPVAGAPDDTATAAHQDPPVTARQRIQLEPSGYATILHAPPSARPVERMKRYEPEEVRLVRELGITPEDARRRVNPDAASYDVATTLRRRLETEAAGNYVGLSIVRDPYARFAVHFRSDAAATLARFTSDERFVAVEGGIPRKELEPLFESWMARFAAEGLVNSGSMQELEGRIEFDINVEKTRFDAIARRKGWRIPDSVDLHFPPPPDPDPIDPAVASLIRVFPRNERSPGPVTLEYSSARLILRDGCFRLENPGGAEPLVLFDDGVRFALDDEGYPVVFHPLAVAHGQGPVRVGEIVVTGGNRGFDEGDPGTRAVRAACGDAPIIALGAPKGEHEFKQRYPPR